MWRVVISESPAKNSTLHGPEHWARVERHGLYICKTTPANPRVVALFALFHDCMRLSDGRDPGHGERGAQYARDLREQMPRELGDLSDEEFELLCEACKWHTDKIHTKEPTLAACWDADRLDYGRIGVDPNPEFLNTPAAKEIAGTRERRFRNGDNPRPR